MDMRKNEKISTRQWLLMVFIIVLVAPILIFGGCFFSAAILSELGLKLSFENLFLPITGGLVITVIICYLLIKRGVLKR